MQTMLRPEWSRKMRFFSFISMLLLVYVHGYDLNDRYLQPFSYVDEPMTATAFFEHLTANGLFRFRIPMLFAISGYLLALGDDKGYFKTIRKRFRTLAVPYFIWSALGLLVAWGLYQLPAMREVVFNAHLQPTYNSSAQTFRRFEEFTGNDWLRSFLVPTSYQLWFLRSLFMLNLIYPLLRWGLQKSAPVLFVLATVFWLLTPAIGVPFVESEGMLPFCLGIWLCKRGKDLSVPPRWFAMRIFLPLFLLVVFGKTWLAFHMRGLVPAEVPGRLTVMFLYKVTVALGFLIAWYGGTRVAEAAMRRPWFVKLSAYSFIIYALHVPLLTYLIDPVHALLQPFPYYRILTYGLLPLCIIAGCIGVGALLRRTLPGVYGLLTGDRGLKPVHLPPASPAPGPVLRVVPAADPASAGPLLRE
ncbi:MAG: acyltransferase [Chitinophagaceae bacterium]|nr:MAG: acyltransferase [Chitinophagaceae bacterium]